MQNPKNEIDSQPKKTKLSLKQKLFVKEYLANKGNGTQAALKVYNTKNYNSAHSIASENLQKPAIQEEISKNLEDLLSPAAKQKTVKEIADIAYTDDRKVMTHKVKCLDLLSKIQELQTERIEKTVKTLNINIDLSKLSSAELQKMIGDGIRNRA